MIKFNFKAIHSSVIVLLTTILLSGCASYALDDAQNEIRDSFGSGDFEYSQKLLKKYEKKDVYRKKDEVLMNLEGGMIYHFSGEYDSSFVYFSEAEQNIDENFTKSISRGLTSMLINDNKLVYDGEPYEDVYLNAFNALNFVHQREFESALVETRKMSFKMEQMDIRIKGLANAFSKTDTTGNVDWDPGELNIQNSAFAHYLSAILYAKTGKKDDARIEKEKLLISLNEQSQVRKSVVPQLDTFDNLDDPEMYNILISAFSGQAPVKYENNIRLYWDPTDTYIKFSFPSIKAYPSSVSSIRTVINENEIVQLDLIEEMDQVALDIYKAKEPIIYARALLRAVLKIKGTDAISDRVGKENKGLGQLLRFIGGIGLEFTEKADLRGWQTLPGQAWMKVIKLPVGIHTLQTEYLDDRGNVMLTESFEVDIRGPEDLEIIESIYSR